MKVIKHILIAICSYIYPTAIFAQNIRMGIVEHINGKDYYKNVGIEHNALIDKWRQSIEYDSIITDTFRVKKIKRVRHSTEYLTLYIANRTENGF